MQNHVIRILRPIVKVMVENPVLNEERCRSSVSCFFGAWFNGCL